MPTPSKPVFVAYSVMILDSLPPRSLDGQPIKGFAHQSKGTKGMPYTMIMTKNDSDEPEKKHIGFVTNRPDVDVEKYSKLWGIESRCRMLEKIRVKTSRRDPAVREFCFLYSMLLFNAWVIANATPYHQSRTNSHAVPLETFKELTLEILNKGILSEPPPD